MQNTFQVVCVLFRYSVIYIRKRSVFSLLNHLVKRYVTRTVTLTVLRQYNVAGHSKRCLLLGPAVDTHFTVHVIANRRSLLAPCILKLDILQFLENRQCYVKRLRRMLYSKYLQCQVVKCVKSNAYIAKENNVLLNSLFVNTGYSSNVNLTCKFTNLRKNV